MTAPTKSVEGMTEKELVAELNRRGLPATGITLQYDRSAPKDKYRLFALIRPKMISANGATLQKAVEKMMRLYWSSPEFRLQKRCLRRCRDMANDLIPFLLTYTLADGRTTSGEEWRTRTRGAYKAHGKPTTENIGKKVAGIEASTLPGQINDHLTKNGPYTIVKAWVHDQRTGEVKAVWVRA